MKKPPLIFVLTLVPKNILSYVVGWLLRFPLIKLVRRPVGGLFVKLFKINLAEAEHSLEHFRSLEEIFTRSIKPSLRPIESQLVSPADGYLAQSRELTSANMAIQAKGLRYSVGELIFGNEAHLATCPDRFRPHWFVTVYLAPHNYHRVHAPMAGELTRIFYHSGELWPVNPPLVKNLPRLFNRNERLVFEIEVSKDTYYYVVMVGATNVGRISTPYVENFVSNSALRAFAKGLGLSSKKPKLTEAKKINAGDELGTFMLGSTVVVVFDKAITKALQLKKVKNTDLPIKMGQTLLI